MTGRFSFEVVDAVDYDELRPSYAPEAVEWVAERGSLRGGSTVVDLAAGTGQLSRRFADLGVDLVAVEPAENMRAVLGQRLPFVRVIDATAEALPLEDDSVDGIVVGNAFHHFDREIAFAEIRRVLRPGGILALFWAWQLEGEQRAIPEMEQVFEVVERSREASAIIAAYRSWAEPPAPAAGFEPFERREFALTHELPSARLADLYATSSDVASLAEPMRNDVLDRIRLLASGLPDVLHLPARSVVDLCVRR